MGMQRMNPFGTHPGPTRLLSLAEFKKGKNIAVKRLLEAAASGLFPLFVPMPSDRKALRIDKATNDLAIRTEFFTNPHYDEWKPGLLRLSLSTCAVLAAKGKAEATDFPYAVCRDQLRDAPADSTGLDDLRRSQPVNIVAIPPNREYVPQALDDVNDCWRLFHPDEQDPSAYVPLLVTPDMLIARSDYLSALESLNKPDSRAYAGKSNESYRERHEKPRSGLADLAEQYAKLNPDSCQTLNGLVECVMDLRDKDEFLDLRPSRKPFSRQWVYKTLRERFDFSGGTPVRKPFTKQT